MLIVAKLAKIHKILSIDINISINDLIIFNQYRVRKQNLHPLKLIFVYTYRDVQFIDYKETYFRLWFDIKLNRLAMLC